MTTPRFSLCHATARLPNGWRNAQRTWMENCDRPLCVEYLLAIDSADILKGPPDVLPHFFRVVENTGPATCVSAWNAASHASTGKFLIAVADDFYPPPHWDTELLKVIPDLDGEYVIETRCGKSPEDDEWFRLITHPMMTRSYYERRGSNIFHPSYDSMYCDVEFTDVARRDGVVIDARHLLFEHRHWIGSSTVGEDEVYRKSGSPERYDRGIQNLGARRAAGFPL